MLFKICVQRRGPTLLTPDHERARERSVLVHAHAERNLKRKSEHPPLGALRLQQPLDLVALRTADHGELRD